MNREHNQDHTFYDEMVLARSRFHAAGRQKRGLILFGGPCPMKSSMAPGLPSSVLK